MKKIILSLASVSCIKHISDYTSIMNSPEDLELLQTQWAQNANANLKYDLDGDGVEDNVDLNSGQLDAFLVPNPFGEYTGGIHNTRHGNLPGELQKEFDATETEPEDKWQIVKAEW